MSSLISWVRRLRSALLIGRSCELSSCARTVRTRWSSSAWSRLASYSCGPSCLSSSVCTSCLSCSRRSCSALPRRLPTRALDTAAVRARMLPWASPPVGPAGPPWSDGPDGPDGPAEGAGPTPEVAGSSVSGPRGGGAVGGAAPTSVCLRAAARRSARLLTMSPLDPEELGEAVVLAGLGMAAVVGAARRGRLAGEHVREVAEGRARRVVRARGDDRGAGVGGGGDVDRGGDLGRDVHPEDGLDLLGTDADGVVRPVEQQIAVSASDVQHLERVQGDLDVLQRGDVEGGHDDALVGLVEGGQGLLVEGR